MRIFIAIELPAELKRTLLKLRCELPGARWVAAAVQAAIRACDLPVEERPFSPHLTLARPKFPATREAEAFLDQPLPPLPAFPVQEFILFASRLTPHGAEHLPLYRFPLPGRA